MYTHMYKHTHKTWCGNINNAIIHLQADINKFYLAPGPPSGEFEAGPSARAQSVYVKHVSQFSRPFCLTFFPLPRAALPAS